MVAGYIFQLVGLGIDMLSHDLLEEQAEAREFQRQLFVHAHDQEEEAFWEWQKRNDKRVETRNDS